MTPAPARSSAAPTAPKLLLVGIFLILLTAALRLGAGFLLPIAIAGLFTLLLDPPVRALRRLGVPTSVGAGLLVFGTVGVLVSGGVLLSGPAGDWVESAPRTLVQAQTKVRKLLRPWQETARKVEKATETAPPGGPPRCRSRRPGSSSGSASARRASSSRSSRWCSSPTSCWPCSRRSGPSWRT